jgi:hypothetical protein
LLLLTDCAHLLSAVISKLTITSKARLLLLLLNAVTVSVRCAAFDPETTLMGQTRHPRLMQRWYHLGVGIVLRLHNCLTKTQLAVSSSLQILQPCMGVLTMFCGHHC